jgi:hypothetical protein
LGDYKQLHHRIGTDNLVPSGPQQQGTPPKLQSSHSSLLVALQDGVYGHSWWSIQVGAVGLLIFALCGADSSSDLTRALLCQCRCYNFWMDFQEVRVAADWGKDMLSSCACSLGWLAGSRHSRASASLVLSAVLRCVCSACTRTIRTPPPARPCVMTTWSACTTANT